jgi:hypothetical protein
LYFNTIGERNTAIGDSALYFNTEGNRNTAIGNAALVLNVTGDNNTAVGAGALQFNHADGNTAIGADALSHNNEGLYNVAVGTFALDSNTTGTSNTAIGFSALGSNSQGINNTAIGDSALQLTTSSSNTAVGYGALLFNTNNGANTAVGWEALYASSGQGNTALGHAVGDNVKTANNVICIGAHGADVNDSCYIGNIWQQPGGSQAVYVNASGKLGAQVSSGRFKDEIKPMEEASEVIYSLKPVSFRYKPEIEPARPRGFGLIAEEVEKINSDLVARDTEGKPYSVRYDQVNAMLLNEFLKEHRKNEEQQVNIERQQKQIEALTATVKEQASQIQKVSAQLAAASPSGGGLEASKPAPQVVNNP